MVFIVFYMVYIVFYKVLIFEVFGSAATPAQGHGRGQGHPQAHLGQDQPSWGPLPPRWANLGPTWANLGPTWADFGPNLGHFWGRLGHSGRVAPGAAVFFASGPHSGLISASVVLRLRCCPQSRRSQKYCKNRGENGFFPTSASRQRTFNCAENHAQGT